MKNIILIILTLSLVACNHQEPNNVIRVGTIAGPETELMIAAQKVALHRYGLHIKVIPFNDYMEPNTALFEGDIDANAFQHMPFLRTQNKTRNYHIVAVAKTFLFPIALYSSRINHLHQITPHSEISIPSDPSNERRALLLLQSAHLIKLKPNHNSATINDITSNPLHLKILPLDTASLSRTLSDVTAAVINSNFASVAGLKIQNALFVETTHSPYTNIIATTPRLVRSKKILYLIHAYQSPSVLKKARLLFGNNALPGWTISNKPHLKTNTLNTKT